MGGRGSGTGYRYCRNSGKDVVENRRSIDILYYYREKALVPGAFVTTFWHQGTARENSIGMKMFEDHFEISYEIQSGNSEKEEIKYQVPLSWTPCNYGGKRPWFRCPNKNCNRRVRKLYFGSKFFLCRHCLNLVYHTQRQQKHDRLADKAAKMRKELGGGRGFHYSFPDKPKGMHWRTYMKKTDEILRTEDASLDAAVYFFKSRFGIDFEM